MSPGMTKHPWKRFRPPWHLEIWPLWTFFLFHFKTTQRYSFHQGRNCKRHRVRCFGLLNSGRQTGCWSAFEALVVLWTLWRTDEKRGQHIHCWRNDLFKQPEICECNLEAMMSSESLKSVSGKKVKGLWRLEMSGGYLMSKTRLPWLRWHSRIDAKD